MTGLRQRIQLASGWATADLTEMERVDAVLLPKRVDVELSGGPERLPGLTMRLEVVDGRPQCRELTIRAVPGGREVRDSDLAALRVAQWCEDTYAAFALALAHQEGTNTTWTPADDSSGQAAVHQARKNRRMTPEHLREVAAVYIAHRSGKPTVAVAEQFGVAHRTAALWANKATEAGYLPIAAPGRRRR